MGMGQTDLYLARVWCNLCWNPFRSDCVQCCSLFSQGGLAEAWCERIGGWVSAARGLTREFDEN